MPPADVPLISIAAVAPEASVREPTPSEPVVFRSLPGLTVAPVITVTSLTPVPFPPSVPFTTSVEPV